MKKEADRWDGFNRLSNIAVDELEVRQKYHAFGSVAYYGGDSLKAAQPSINQMIATAQNS